MKRIPELITLSRDHHRALVLARKAKNAEIQHDFSVQEIWSEIEKYFETALELHFKIEELYIGAPLIEVGENELAERLYNEHEAMRVFFKPRSSRTSSELKRFGYLLEKHVRFEERELFESVQKNLNPEAIKALDTACNNGTHETIYPKKP